MPEPWELNSSHGFKAWRANSKTECNCSTCSNLNLKPEIRIQRWTFINVWVLVELSTTGLNPRSVETKLFRFFQSPVGFKGAGLVFENSIIKDIWA